MSVASDRLAELEALEVSAPVESPALSRLNELEAVEVSRRRI